MEKAVLQVGILPEPQDILVENLQSHLERLKPYLQELRSAPQNWMELRKKYDSEVCGWGLYFGQNWEEKKDAFEFLWGVYNNITERLAMDLYSENKHLRAQVKNGSGNSYGWNYFDSLAEGEILSNYIGSALEKLEHGEGGIISLSFFDENGRLGSGVLKINPEFDSEILGISLPKDFSEYTQRNLILSPVYLNIELPKTYDKVLGAYHHLINRGYEREVVEPSILKEVVKRNIC